MNRYVICNEMFENWEPERVFAFAAQLGYGGVEIAPFTLAPTASEVSPQRRRELKQSAEAAGVSIIGLHWLLAKTTGFHLTTADDAVRQRTVEYLGELAELCADLGGELMVFGSPGQRSLEPGTTVEQAWTRACDVFKAAAPAFERTGVTLCFEPLGRPETNFITTAAEGTRLCDEVDHPNVRLHLDVKAMSDEGRDIGAIIRENKRHLHHFHANDPNRLGPGMGAVKFEPIRNALEDVGYSGFISVEVFDFAPGPENIARQSLAYLKRIFAQ